MGKQPIKNALVIVGILGILGVALGALGAHALKKILTAEQVTSFQTGVRYHLVHTVVLLALTLFKPNKWITRAFGFFLLGILFFSFSIYLLNLRHVWGLDFLTFLGPITPIGGLLLMIGWGCIAGYGWHVGKATKRQS